MNAIKDKWFSEISELWPGQCMSLEVQEVLYHEKSDFQDIQVVKRYTIHYYMMVGVCYCYLMFYIA